MDLTNVPAPTVLKPLSYETVLAEKMDIIKQLRPDWEPVEGDDFSVIAEAWAYDDVRHTLEFNNAVKAMLLPYSTGDDLDNLAVMYGVERLPGSRPRAMYEFKLSAALDKQVYIPAGFLLASRDGSAMASTYADLTIEAGATSAQVEVELHEYVATSSEAPDVMVTPLPYLSTVQALEGFSGGASVEDDEDFRERILMSLYSPSTAGSWEAYWYWTKSADARIRDVYPHMPEPGHVHVYVLADSYDAELWTRCREAASSEKKRPLTDLVEFHEATEIAVDVTATVYLSDMAAMDTVDAVIRSNLSGKSWGLGQDLALSWVYAQLHVDNVSRVELAAPNQNVACAFNEAAAIGNITINYEQETGL